MRFLSFLFAETSVPCFLTLVLVALGSINVHSKSECEKSAPHKLGTEGKFLLCQNAADGFPGSCAKSVYRLKGFDVNSTIALCQHASSNGPAECARDVPLSVKAETKVLLCSQQPSSSGPAQCFKNIKSNRFSLTDHEKAQICGAFKGGSVEPSECVNRLPKNFGKPEVMKLCTSSKTPLGSALCATSVTGNQHSAEIIATLCEGAVSKAPADCFRRAPAGLHPVQRARLCRGAGGGSGGGGAGAGAEGPALCARAVAGRTYAAEDKIVACRGAEGTGPARCLAALAALSGVAPADKAALCAGARSDAPARCLKEARTVLRPVGLALALCQEAAAAAAGAGAAAAGEGLLSAAAACARAAPHGLAAEQKLALCRGANSTAPAACAKRAHGRYPPEHAHLAVDLCRGADWAVAGDEAHVGGVANQAGVEAGGEVGPAECFLRASQAHQDRLSEADRTALCRRAPGVGPAACAAAAHPPQRFTHTFKVAVCAGATGAGPMRCANAAPSTWPEDRAAALCRGAADAAPAECARAAPFFLAGAAAAAELCAGAAGVTPAVCAATVGSALPGAQAVALCRGARSLTPAYCALGRRRPALTPEELEHCRTAASIPSALKLAALGYEGRMLLPNTPFFVHLILLDQYSQPMLWDSGTYVTVSLPVKGSNGAQIGGTRAQPTQNGVVVFGDLSIDIAGDYTLKFSVESRGHLLSVFAAVGRPWARPHDPCAAVYDLLQSPGGGGGGAEEAQRDYFLTELLPSGRHALRCLAAGALGGGWRWEPAWGGGLWVTYPAPLAALDSELGCQMPT